ncbi:MAG: hypothetical protein KDE53_27760, partial [Caldilineaceae bacterium]|nr:hypothetical protein [Caldilineaceae bacterium]
MKRILFTLFLLGLLALLTVQGDGWSLTPKAALAQESTTAQLPEPTLYMPSNVQRAFDNGTRSPDGNVSENYWQNRSEHTMTINIAPPSRTISATEEITYYNNSPGALDFVAIRLYFNVHQPEAMRRKQIMPEFLNSGIVVDEFRVNGEVKPWPGPAAPGSTLAVVPLEEPLPSNASISLGFDWHFDLADAESFDGGSAWKEGAIDETTYFLGYFYPRVDVYDDIDGWDASEFDLSAEWYGDFVDYTFAVNVPRNFVVWATGDLLNLDEVLQPEYAQRLEESYTSDEVINIAQPDEIQGGLVTTQDDTVTWQWRADNVRDIAIAVGDHYYWDAGSVVVDPATGRRASVQAVYNEEATDFQEMVEFGKSALAFGSTEWPGVPYPYSHSTIIRGGADEEYPMMANDASDPEDPTFTRFVAAHELLHSWFPFYMGIDERRYPMLDEGWVTAFEYLINVRDLGAAEAAGVFQTFRVLPFIAPNAARDLPIITPLDAMQGGSTSFSANPYGKPAQAYLALKELMGDEALKAALHEFMDRWNGKHPLPWDMFNTFNDVSDEDLTWFFNAWFFEPNYADLALESVEEVDGGYEVQIRNVGGWPIPFDVDVIYADGSQESVHQNPAIWQDADTATIQIDSDQELQSVTLNNGIFQDYVVADNAWESESSTETSGTDGGDTEGSGTENEDGALGLGDTYYPLEGNPGYDAQHYTIDLAVDVATNTIDGSTTMEALATDELASFDLDFMGLEISAVTVDGIAAAFSRDRQELTITPSAPIAADANFTVSVAYSGTPEPNQDQALFLAGTSNGWLAWGEKIVGAANQPDGAMNWIPSNNHPSDKATFTFRITVDDPNVAVASGILQEVIAVDNDTNTYIWAMDAPMATQIATVMVGEFERVESVAPNGVPIRNYFLPGTDQADIDAFDPTGEMMVYLEELLGPYPYEAYGVMVIPDYIADSALETQSLSTFDDFGAEAIPEVTVMHELFHQWYGNTLTVADWGDLWLHEGFARYSEVLWYEHTGRLDDANALLTAAYEGQLHTALAPEEYAG